MNGTIAVNNLLPIPTAPCCDPLLLLSHSRPAARVFTFLLSLSVIFFLATAEGPQWNTMGRPWMPKRLNRSLLLSKLTSTKKILAASSPRLNACSGWEGRGGCASKPLVDGCLKLMRTFAPGAGGVSDRRCQACWVWETCTAKAKLAAAFADTAAGSFPCAARASPSQCLAASQLQSSAPPCRAPAAGRGAAAHVRRPGLLLK